MIRIACFGYVSQGGPSGAGANFYILEELLNRGLEIDFFGWEGFNHPVGLLNRPNIKFIALPNQFEPGEFLKKKLPYQTHNFFDNTIGALIQNFYSAKRKQRSLSEAILANHSEKKYDLLLFLNLYSPLRIEDVPTISWVQGPPQTEWFYTKQLKSKIIELCGAFTYYKVALFYLVKNSRLASEIENTDIFICGSQWSKQGMVSYGLKADAVKVVPYPLNMDLFQPRISESTQPGSKEKVLLWLGRIDPRKRFDLLMDAYKMLLEERKDVHLKVSGVFRYAEGYKQLIDEFPFPEHIEYSSSVDHRNVPDLIRSCDVVVQPSEGENFGFAVAEALCCGVPVILGPDNGTKDYIHSSSFVFEEYEPVALKDAMVRALDAVEANAEKLAIDARNAAELNFSIHKVIDALERIFEEALSLYARPPLSNSTLVEQDKSSLNITIVREPNA